MASSSTDKAWTEIQPPEGLGLDCGQYKFIQNQTFVEVYIRIPDNVTGDKVQVALTPSRIQVTLDGRELLNGDLFQDVKVEESTWYIADGILQMSLLKRNRRGFYVGNSSNADTFWSALLKRVGPITASLSTIHQIPITRHTTSCLKERLR
eukprot:jgi/Botrbrau1/12520/Bobra.0169s0062.1